MGGDPLEVIWPLLPGPVALNPNLDTSEYHLLSATEINAQLHNISIFDGEELRFHIRLAQPDVVEEGTRRATDIFNLPLTVPEAELAVLSANNFGLETDWGV